MRAEGIEIMVGFEVLLAETLGHGGAQAEECGAGVGGFLLRGEGVNATGLVADVGARVVEEGLFRVFVRLLAEPGPREQHAAADAAESVARLRDQALM